MKPLPSWLAEKIAVADRKAQSATCRCGTPVLAGLDGDRCAGFVIVDADPLPGPLGELRALMAGLDTYSLLGGDLAHRTDAHHRRDLVGRRTLHAEHRCPNGGQA